MAKKIAGYDIESVENGTTCKLYFAKKWGRRYVIKEYSNIRFLSPKSRYSIEKYPHLAESEKRAQIFYRQLRHTANLMRKNCRREGLINIPERIFRRNTSIFKVSRLVESSGIPYAELHHQLNRRQMDVFLRSILIQLCMLEKMQFVDLDVKPENLVVQKKNGCYTACLIDYEGGYVVNQSGPRNEMEFTPEFAAPELLYYQNLLEQAEPNDPESEQSLNEAYDAIRFSADTFSAGCVFCYALSGNYLCSQEMDDCTIPGGKLLMERPLWIPKFHPVWRMIVKEMLRYEPALRPGARFILQTVEKARRIGLMQQADMPFEKLVEYDLEDKDRQMSQQLVRMGTYQNERCALWFLDNVWLGEKADHLSPKSLWGRLNIAAQRRLDYMASILEEANRCAEETELIAPGWLVETLPFSFCRQADRFQGWATFKDFCPNGMLKTKADALMLELLRTVGVLHSHGLLQCVMDEDDLWFFTDDDGKSHALLARPQRFIWQNKLPLPQDIDARSDLLPVEMYSYLGQHDRQGAEELASSVGPEADIFILGLIYHRLLCGAWPQIAGPESISLGMAGMEGEDGILIHSRIDLKRQAVIRKMLAFEPMDRPHTCMEAATMVRTKRIPDDTE